LDFFQIVILNFVLNICAIRANSKFLFVRAAHNKIHLQKVTVQMQKPHTLEKACLYISASQSSSLTFGRQRFFPQKFRARFIKTINVRKIEIMFATIFVYVNVYYTNKQQITSS